MQPTSLTHINMQDVLQTLVFQQLSAVTAVVTDRRHGSKIARVAPGSWQARVLRDMAELRHVQTLADFQQAMGEYRTPVVFIGDDVTIDRAAIARICAASGHDKTIIWEDSGIA